jgi:acyl-CoA synthetase (AMP-forming)/AMP-acid ligase II/thioesterase domain-containing protein/acyl carrier protein
MNPARPDPVSLWNLFERTAIAHGDSLAIIEGSNRWTYTELLERSLQVSRDLEPYIAGKAGLRVAVEAGLDAGTAAAILGTLGAGGIVVPVDPSHPAAYRRTIVEDAAPTVFLEGRSGKARPAAPAPLQVDGEPFGVGDLSGISVLLWTSGSTGRPKGVAVTGAPFALEARNCMKAYSLGPGERVGLTSSPTFAGAMAAFFTTLLSGAALVPADLRILGLGGTNEWLDREQVTLFRPPVSFYRQWVRTLSAKTVPGRLRMVTLGGQSLCWDDLADFRDRFPADRVIVHRYACTEAALVAHAAFGGGCPFPEEGKVPLGKPPDGVGVVILGEDGSPVPGGAKGEIGVVGGGLASGYWKNPGLTRERFVKLDDGTRLYRTGDLGCLLPDGTLFLGGRLDGQVKIRGFRVETARVEEALRDVPGVGEAAAKTWIPPSSPGEPVLVGYIAPSGEARLTVDGIRRHLEERLPDYMIPGRFLVVRELPRTPGGKVDRSRLPDPKPGRPDLSVPFVPPEGPVQQALAGLWEEILGVSPIGVLDDFFDLGGHSVQAARLFGKLERVFGLQLPLARLYQGRNIRDMAALLAQGKTGEWSSIVPIRTGTGGFPLFLVHAVGGNAIGFGPLGDRLQGCDTYGIQAWGLHPRHFPHLSVEEMAAHYISEMQRIQKNGPYRVLGYSFGGVIAFEMACQLESAGEEVAFLGMLDRRALLLECGKGFKRNAMRVWNDVTRRIKLSIRIPLAKALLALGLPVPFMHRIATGAIKRMATTYSPGSSYGGAMDLFLVDIPEEAPDKPLRAWAHHVKGPLRRHAVPGNHQTMLEEPHVRTLAEKLLKALDEGE